MKMFISNEKLRKLIETDEEPEGCIICGAIAGACLQYPNCPGNPDWKSDSPIPDVKDKEE